MNNKKEGATPKNQNPERWPYVKGKIIVDSKTPGYTHRHEHQQLGGNIFRSVRMKDNDLEYFIFEDDVPSLTTRFLDSLLEGDIEKNKLDFEHVHIRVPAGFRNVVYTLGANGLIENFDTDPKQEKLGNGFFGTLLLHFRKSGDDIPPFIHKNGLYHHCEGQAIPQNYGKDCPKLVSYGFERRNNALITKFNKLKVFFYQGQCIKINKKDYFVLGPEKSRNARIISKKGFYLVPLLLPEKAIVFAVFCKNGDTHKPVKDQINETFFRYIQAEMVRSPKNDLLFVETPPQLFRDDDLSILYKLAFLDDSKLNEQHVKDLKKHEFTKNLSPEREKKINGGNLIEITGCKMPDTTSS